jgi:hypothetical protein
MHGNRFHFRRCGAVLLAALLANAAWAAPPPEAMQPDTGMQSVGIHGDAFDDGKDNEKTTPLPWNQLNSDQRGMLAPLQSQWDRLPPRRQQRMAAHAEHWNQLPPERREQIRQHLAHWAQMTPEQRRDAAQNEHAFQSMAPADRERVQEVYKQFQSLTPEQQQILKQRFREQRAARRRMHEGMPEPDQQPPPQH